MLQPCCFRFYLADLKKNIFVISTGPDWWVKIGDFGISKRVMEGFTGLQTFNGMPAFTAPEVYERLWGPSPESATSGSDYCPEIDIWALGVITYYLLTGKFPFSGKSDLLEYYQGHSILPFDSSHSPVSPEATSFLASMMAANPADRPTARDALDCVWLIPMLLDSLPDNPVQIAPATQDIAMTAAAPKQKIPSTTQYVLQPGEIDLTPGAPKHSSRTERAQQMQTSLGIDGDTYKQLIDTLNSAKLTGFTNPIANPSQLYNGHPPADTDSIAPSQSSESQPSKLAHHTSHTQRISEKPTSVDIPSYNRRRSDAAPIPISELSHVTPVAGSPTSRSPSTSIKNSSDRFSEKIRWASRSIMPKPNRRSQDHAPTSPISPNPRYLRFT
jgi:serine/threonine protein kinase